MRIREGRAALALLVWCGCVHLDAEPVGGPSANTEPRAMFDTQVYPILVVECSDCHSTDFPNPDGFVAPNVSTAYETVINYQGLMGDFTPAGTPLVTTADDSHPGQFTPNELQIIDDWLAVERAARGL